jgi:hypothetical protein
MPIAIICPGCHSRFQVSEKFGGKQGPCPKCKTLINIPKASEQVKIAEPDDYGGTKDTKGKLVLKPIEREETHLSPNAVVAIGAVCILTLGLAWMIGRAWQVEPEPGTEPGTTVHAPPDVPPLVLGIGAVLLAPPLVLAGYSFLRDDELEPYRGRALWIRAALCAAAYAALWGAYALLNQRGFLSGPQVWIFAGPPFFVVGGAAAFAALDLEFGSAVMHYAFYLGVTVVLRLVMGLLPV